MKRIIEVTGIAEEEISNAWCFGSRVYGTAAESSDFDFVIVSEMKKQEEYKQDDVNVLCFTKDEFYEMLKAHEMSSLECYFAPEAYCIRKGTRFEFSLNKQLLRHSLSEKSSNSWVKAKKKLTVEKDYDLYAGQKSLFHAFRIIDFGIQIAESGRIVDYGRKNNLLKEIKKCTSWEEMNSRFKSPYNQLMTEFRKLAPK